jgi:Ni/Co efflux regulator RcnB
MKSLFIATAAAALIFVAPAAFADPPDHHGGNHHGDQKSDNKATKPAKPANTPSTSGRVSHSNNAARMNDRSNTTTRTNANPGTVYNRAVQQRNNNNNNNNRNLNNNNRNDRNGANNRNHSWRNNFNRRNVTASHHYRWRGRSWNWPSGYRYQRWTFGMTLPSVFWSNNYWISDYSDYGLGAPPFGTVWVRYNDDAILIDRDTGEILEVVYDQFG